MPQVSVDNLKRGAILSANVQSPLGGCLLERGTRILDREYEILLAFQIDKVDIEKANQGEGFFLPSIFNEPSTYLKKHDDKLIPSEFASSSTPAGEAVTQKKLESVPGKPTALSFEQQFLLTVQSVKVIFTSVSRGNPLSLTDIQSKLRPLLLISADPGHILVLLKQQYSLQDYLFFHSVAVGFISICIARWSKLAENEMMDLFIAGVLHDIGKVKMNPDVVNKPGPLNEGEWKDMKKYPVIGYHLIKGISSIPDSIPLGVLQHQEREDGSGYPLSLPANSIHMFAKIIAIADIFHAMCSLKSYRAPISPYLSLERLVADSFGKLNPAYVHAFVDGMTHFTIGALVELSDGSIGKIVFVDRSQPTRPMVDIKGTIINLSINRNLVIMRLIM